MAIWRALSCSCSAGRVVVMVLIELIEPATPDSDGQDAESKHRGDRADQVKVKGSGTLRKVVATAGQMTKSEARPRPDPWPHLT